MKHGNTNAVNYWLLALLLSFLSACSEPPQPPPTLEEAKTLKYRLTLKGTGLNFDIPIAYDHSTYVRNRRQWFRPPQDRKEVDYIDITAILPDMEPYTEANANEFDNPGWGLRVMAGTTYLPRANWNYYFENFASRLERLPDSQEVPGMLHYRDALAQHEVYLSHDHAVKELVFISCPYRVPPQPSPSCKIQTLYKDRFYFEYTFGRAHLSQWRDIDIKLKILFDKFAQKTP